MWSNREMLDLGPWNELAAPRGEFTTLLRGLALDYNQLGSPEPEFLFSLSYRTTGRGAIVELGTFIGTSLLALSLAQKLKGSSRPITTIDVKRRLELDENLAKADLANAVNVVLSDSLAAAASWREPIELRPQAVTNGSAGGKLPMGKGEARSPALSLAAAVRKAATKVEYASLSSRQASWVAVWKRGAGDRSSFSGR